MKLAKLFYLSVLVMSLSSLIFKYFWSYLYQNERDVQYQHTDIHSEDKHQEIYTFNNVTEMGDNLASTAQTNDQRKKRVREQCAIISQTMTKERNGMDKKIRVFDKEFIMGMTDEHLSFVYCRVSKAASYYAISTLRELLDYSEDRFRSFSAGFRHLPYDQMKTTFNSAYTFLFVREPYGRIFSTYSNKFYFPKGHWAPLGTKIVKRYRKNPSEDSLQFGHDITFVELIRFIVDEFESGRKMDVHIRPMHLNCKPCEYEYDFIGKLETLVPDWQYLSQQLKARNIIPNIPPHVGEKLPDHRFSEMTHFRLTISKVKSSNINIYNLYKRAWKYYQMTSMISKHIDMPFVDTDVNEIKYSSFFQELERAVSLSEVNASNLKSQRHEAMLQAYSTVPLELLNKLRTVVLEDCLIYGYEDRPNWLFDRKFKKPSSNKFDYFTDLN